MTEDPWETEELVKMKSLERQKVVVEKLKRMSSWMPRQELM